MLSLIASTAPNLRDGSVPSPAELYESTSRKEGGSWFRGYDRVAHFGNRREKKGEELRPSRKEYGHLRQLGDKLKVKAVRGDRRLLRWLSIEIATRAKVRLIKNE